MFIQQLISYLLEPAQTTADLVDAILSAFCFLKKKKKWATFDKRVLTKNIYNTGNS